MNRINDAHSHDLLSCFFEECESQFRFLEEEHGFMYLSGLAEYQKSYKIIKPYQDSRSPPSSPFFAVTRYEQRARAIEILYGDKHYILEVFIYPDPISRLSLREIVAASRGEVPNFQNMSYLTDTLQVSESLQLFARTIRDNPKIIEPSERLVERANTMQSKLMEQNVREHLKRLIQSASIAAAEAFLDKNYAKVVHVLEPYEPYLSASDHKKLRIAREKTS